MLAKKRRKLVFVTDKYNFYIYVVLFEGRRYGAAVFKNAK